MPVTYKDARGTVGCLWLEGCLGQSDASYQVGFWKARFQRDCRLVQGSGILRDERSESVGLGAVIEGFGFLVQLGATQILENLHKHIVFAATQRNSSATQGQQKCTLQLSCNSVSCS